MKKYYMISLRHTHKRDAFISLWRPNNAGYCWYKDWAGLYTLAGISEALYLTESVLYVREDVLDKMWQPVQYDGRIELVILNCPANLKKLLLKPSLLTEYMHTKISYRLVDDKLAAELQMQIASIKDILKWFEARKQVA